MKIERYASLSEQDFQACMKLVDACRDFDNSYHTPYLFNTYNVNKKMPAFFLARSDESLHGFLSVYSDEEGSAELSLYVAPSQRRKGIASQLYQAFEEVAKLYQINEISFETERVFLNKAVGLLEAWQLTDVGSEFCLERKNVPYLIEKRKELKITEAGLDMIPEIATLKSEAFEKPFEISEFYERKSLETADTLCFVLKENHQIIGSCTIDTSGEYNYIFGLAILKEKRGQGYGSYFLQEIINQMIERNDKFFQIVVDDENPRARKLYQGLGFELKTEVVYIEK